MNLARQTGLGLGTFWLTLLVVLSEPGTQARNVSVTKRELPECVVQRVALGRRTRGVCPLRFTVRTGFSAIGVRCR